MLFPPLTFMMWEEEASFHFLGVLKNFRVLQLNFGFITTLSQNSKETLILGSLVIIEHGSFNAHAKQAYFFLFIFPSSFTRICILNWW